MSIWRYRLTKLISLSSREVVYLLRAQWHLLVAAVLLRLTRRGTLLHQADGPAISGPALDAATVRYAERLALAVYRVAEHGPFRPRCLVRAVALDRLLRGAGIDSSRIRVGVRLRGGEFEAHAWVELSGSVLGDQEWYIRAFTPLSDMPAVMT